VRAGRDSVAVGLLLAAGALAAVPCAAAATPPTLTPTLAQIAQGTHPFKRAAREAVGPVVSGRGELIRQGRRYVVDVTYRHARQIDRARLREAGARIVVTSRPYRTVTVSIPAGRLDALGRVRGVQTVAEDLAPMVSGAAPSGKHRDLCQGSVVSEGDQQLRARKARAKFGVDGSGVTVGVLSNSFDTSASAATHAADDVASHDLPGPGDPCGHTTPVNVLQQTNSADEGRAMLQVVHDLAPGAKLDFATANLGSLAFANNIVNLANAGANVIVDDVLYFDEPFFQDGAISNAVNAVKARGVAYFAAATNENIDSGPNHSVASFEAPAFRDSGSCPSALTSSMPYALYAQHCMDFDPTAGVDDTYGVTIGPHKTLNVETQWAQPAFDVSTDLDVYVISNGAVVSGLGTSEAHNAEGEAAPTHSPAEFTQVTNTGNVPADVDIAIDRCDATCSASRGGGGQPDDGMPLLKLELLDNSDQTTFPNEYVASAGGDIVGPMIFGHPGTAGAIATAAVRYDDSSAPEGFSSPGPVTHYFGPTAGSTPAAPLVPPEVLDKPDVAATDCGLTTFFSSNNPVGSFFRFCGTSEAAPHAAAVAALQLQANPRATPAEVRRAQRQTARPVGAFGPADVGAGLIDAVGAVDEMAAPQLHIPSHPRRRTAARTARFRFRSSEPARFRCSLDGEPFRRCSSPKSYTQLTVGRHTFRVKGTDGVGKTGSAARFSWTITQRHHHA
jgi:Subtilase family